MKHISKLTFFSLFAISAFNTISFCDDSSGDAKLKYLELRGLNYDYVHFYKKSEDHKDKEQYKKSQENALQYKKKLNSYLIKSPTVKSLQDPNGYFSSDEKLGFNPLQEESINSLFKTKPYLVENGSHYFVSKQEDEFSELDIQEPHEIEEISGFSNADFEVKFNDSDFAFDEDGLPNIDNLENENLSTTSSNKKANNDSDSSGISPSNKETQQNDLQADIELDTQDQADSKQIRFDKGVDKLNQGVSDLTISIKHLSVSMKKYKDYIQSDSVNPDKVNHMRDLLQMQLSRLHRINGVLRGYNQGLSVAGKNHDLDGLQALHKINRNQIASENNLDTETQRFENLMEETGNTYRFIPTESVNTAFLPKDQTSVTQIPDNSNASSITNKPTQQNNGATITNKPIQQNNGSSISNTLGKPTVGFGDSTNIKPLPIKGETIGQKPFESNNSDQKPTGPTKENSLFNKGWANLGEPPKDENTSKPNNTGFQAQPNKQDQNGETSKKKFCLWWPGKLMGSPKPSNCK